MLLEALQEVGPSVFFSLLVIAVASVVSAALACRHLNRLDLVGALKAAE